MLRRLVGNDHTGLLAQLARPHAGAIDHEFGADLALLCAHTGHGAIAGQDTRDRRVLDDPHAFHTGAFGQRHGHVDRVDAAVVLGQKAAADVIGISEREAVAHFFGGQLVDFDAVQAIECGDAAVLFQAVCIRGQLR